MPSGRHYTASELPTSDPKPRELILSADHSAWSFGVWRLADTIVAIEHQFLLQLAAQIFLFDRVVSGCSILHLFLHGFGLVGGNGLCGHFFLIDLLQEAHARII